LAIKYITYAASFMRDGQQNRRHSNTFFLIRKWQGFAAKYICQQGIL
jgi:hypothetical protein